MSIEDARFSPKKQENAFILIYNRNGACVEMSMSDMPMKHEAVKDYSMFSQDEDVIQTVLNKIPKKFGKK